MTETLDKLYLELSALTKARNQRETRSLQLVSALVEMVRETKDLNEAREEILKKLYSIEFTVE